MYLFNKSDHKYDIVHDNLNNIWLIADLSNKKYKFYYRYKYSERYSNINNKKNKLSLSNIINLTISSILLVLLFLSLNSSTKEMSNDRIYNEFYTEYQISNISRSEIKNTNLIDIALLDINNNNNKGALEKLQTIIDNKGENVTIAHFYKGIILQKEGKYKDAIQEYENVIRNNDNLFIEQSNWYIALCYLKTHNKSKSIQYFNKLLYNSSYNKQAQKILSKIN